MIRRSFRIGLTLGLLGGLAFALVKMLGARQHPDAAPAPHRAEPWPPLAMEPTPAAAPVQEAAVPRPEPQPEPAPVAKPAPAHAPRPAPAAAAKKAKPAQKAAAKKAPAKKKAPVKAWVEPKAGVCPTSHPVKGKLTSKIFHLPGMLNYERTNPDRCYRDPTAAEQDGLRQAKR